MNGIINVVDNETQEVPKEQNKKEVPNENKSDWELYEDGGADPVLLSDYEHKAYLINSSGKNIKKANDILDRSLSLSRIDPELANIYNSKMDCIEEWINLGFTDLANRRFIHLMSRLKINNSVGGFERILQTAVANAGIELTEEGMKLTSTEKKEKNPLVELASQFNQRM